MIISLNASIANRIISFDCLINVDVGAWITILTLSHSWENLYKIHGKGHGNCIRTFEFHDLVGVFCGNPGNVTILDERSWNGIIAGGCKFYLVEKMFGKWLDLFSGG